MFARKWSVCAAVGILGAFVLGLFGCGGSSNNSNSTSLLRVFNALVNTPAAGLTVTARNNVKLNPNSPLLFKQEFPGPQVVSGRLVPYGAIASGGNIAITVLPFPGNDTSTQIVKSNSITLDASSGPGSGTYTLAIAGINGQASGSGAAPSITRLIDNFAANPAPSSPTAYIRVVNLSPDSPSGGLTLFNTSGGTSTILSGNNGSLQNVVYAPTNNSGGITNYINVPLTGSSQVFHLTVRNQAGTVIPTATDISNVTFKSPIAYTIFLVGQTIAGGQAFDAVILADNVPQ
jgi:hypothetical protein